MEKKHLGYSDRLLVRVLKSQEKKLKAFKKPKDDKEKSVQADQLQFYKECLDEAVRRGLVEVPAPVDQKEKKPTEEKKD